ncbi:hypothetical protein LIA77_00096 [Sarocladium implicatum]|nr:hypothetical protein LIA77_00096 [Sarocladium implicatum]
MFSVKFFFASLAFAPGSHAAWEYAYRRSPECSPVTVNNVLPTKSFVSPENAACTQTYTTVLPSLATDSKGLATALKPHTYTMTWECDCSPAAPCTLPASPEECPPGFAVTKTVCVECAGGPKTYTLTIPEPASSAGDSSATGEARKPYNPEPKPTHHPETSGGREQQAAGKPKEPTGEASDQPAGDSGNSEHSSGDGPVTGAGGHVDVPLSEPSHPAPGPHAHNGTTAHGGKADNDGGNEDGGAGNGGESDSEINRDSGSSALGLDVSKAVEVLVGSVIFFGIL